jgi:hypothetical protein
LRCRVISCAMNFLPSGKGFFHSNKSNSKIYYQP